MPVWPGSGAGPGIIRDTLEDRYGLGILLVVFKQPGANVIDTVDQIRALLPRMIRNVPPGIEVEVVQTAPAQPSSRRCVAKL